MNLIQLLLDDVKKYPDKMAFSDSHTCCTYAQAWSMVRTAGSFLASLIREIRPDPEESVPVGVLASHDTTTLIAFLSVICSGHFYVPLDPEMPAEKMEKIIRNAELPVIIGRTGQDTLISDYPGSYINLEEVIKDLPDIAEPSETDFSILEFLTRKAESNPDLPLYMVYTSGSTGTPKGVLKSHRAMQDFIDAYIRTFDFSPDEIIGNQTPFYFDASAKDIYLTLKLGATLEIIPEEKFLLPPALVRYLNEKQITMISWVPSALMLITQYNTFTELVPQTLKKVFFVGESFPVKHFRKWQEALPDVEYVNLYGASELAGICCYYRVPGGFEGDSLPIGKPLSNCKVYLAESSSEESDQNAVCADCSESLQVITEPEKPGEIYLVSDALALGYYRDQEKTENVFLSIRGERTFRTGDIAWYDREGNLHFAARNDSQIKHMGHRVELGEIETICQSLPMIDKCCCLYQQEKKRIYLFCQPAQGEQADKKRIFALLKERLAFYMLPQRLVIKEQLPVNANGKIDRQKLRKEMV